MRTSEFRTTVASKKGLVGKMLMLTFKLTSPYEQMAYLGHRPEIVGSPSLQVSIKVLFKD